jgi:hypothetical protein
MLEEMAASSVKYGPAFLGMVDCGGGGAQVYRDGARVFCRDVHKKKRLSTGARKKSKKKDRKKELRPMQDTGRRRAGLCGATRGTVPVVPEAGGRRLKRDDDE